MNIYKLAVFVFIFNFILGSAITVSNITENNNRFSELNRIANQQLINTQSHETNLKNDDSKSSITDYSSSIGSSIKWTGMLKSIFFDSLNPMSLSTEQFDDILAKVLVYILGVFRAIIGVFLTIKIIMAIKNKDTQ